MVVNRFQILRLDGEPVDAMIARKLLGYTTDDVFDKYRIFVRGLSDVFLEDIVRGVKLRTSPLPRPLESVPPTR